MSGADQRPGASGQPASKALQFAILVGSVMIAGSVGYAVARGLGHDELREARSSCQTELATVESERSSIEGELVSTRETNQARERTSTRRIQALEARRQLAMAIDALDRRNFGTATARLSTASALLDGELHGEVMRDLSADLGNAQLTVADDLQDARMTVHAFATRLDGSIGGSESTDTAPTASAEAAPNTDHRDDDPRMVGPM